MVKKLKALFDYQRFENDSHLAKLIAETEARESAELPEEELELIAAAGNVFEQNAKEEKRGPGDNAIKFEDITDQF